MKREIKITSDHLKLIKNLNFEEFEMGDKFDTGFICDAIKQIESSQKSMIEYGNLRDDLVRIDDQLQNLNDEKSCHAWGINQWSLFGGTYAMEDIAMILGCYEFYIKGTEEDPMGKQFPKDLENYMWTLYNDIVSNMKYIIRFMFHNIGKEIKLGLYVYNTNDDSWTLKETYEPEDTWKHYIGHISNEI